MLSPAWAIAAVLIVAALWWAWRARPALDGVWLGVPAFLKDAGLAEAQLYVDGADGYLYMADAAGGVVADGPARVGGTWAGRLTLGHPLFPEPLEYEAAGGLLRVWRGAEVLLYLWRDPVASREAALGPAGPKAL